MKRDPLGDRMKRYESVSRLTLMRRSCVILRIDGRAFHTYTRGLNRPFDLSLANDMLAAAIETAYDMQGFQVGYHQSDEVSFFLHDFARIETEAWFGNDLQKIVSITASEFTRFFNDARWERGATMPSFDVNTATFDCRAFTIPHAEVANYFLWRARDWHRNSLFMYASSFYSAKELLSKGREELHEMLHARGKNWTTDLPDVFRNGTFFRREITAAADTPGDITAIVPSHRILPKHADIAEYIAPAFVEESAEG